MLNVKCMPFLYVLYVIKGKNGFIFGCAEGPTKDKWCVLNEVNEKGLKTAYKRVSDKKGFINFAFKKHESGCPITFKQGDQKKYFYHDALKGSMPQYHALFCLGKDNLGYYYVASVGKIGNYPIGVRLNRLSLAGLQTFMVGIPYCVNGTFVTNGGTTSFRGIGAPIPTIFKYNSSYKDFGKWRVNVVEKGDFSPRGIVPSFQADNDVIVEFYDKTQSKNHFPFGQFVSSYYGSTLIKHFNDETGTRLNLDTSVPGWVVEEDDYAEMWGWLYLLLQEKKYPVEEFL